MTIQALTPSTDPEWGPVEQWQDIDEVRASVTASGGAESLKDEGVQASTKYTVRMRYRADVSAVNRLAWSGKVLEIVSVVNVEQRNRELLIECVEHQ